MLSRRSLMGLVPVIAMAGMLPGVASVPTPAHPHYLKGWQFIDNSGDGGLFGFHYRAYEGHGFCMSAGGVEFDDHLYPVTAYDNLARTPVMLSIYKPWANGQGCPNELDPREYYEMLDGAADFNMLFACCDEAMDFVDHFIKNSFI